jgi:hypothetical protein
MRMLLILGMFCTCQHLNNIKSLKILHEFDLVAGAVLQKSHLVEQVLVGVALFYQIAMI